LDAIGRVVDDAADAVDRYWPIIIDDAADAVDRYWPIISATASAVNSPRCRITSSRCTASFRSDEPYVFITHDRIKRI